MSRAARLILMSAILAALGGYVWHAREDLTHILAQFDPRYSLPMLAVPLASLAVNGLIGRDLAAEFGVRLSPAEWYGLSTVNALGNYLPVPQAGAMARGLYLKKVHHLPYATYAATLVVTYVSSLALGGLTGLAALGALALRGRPTPWPLWLIFGALAASVVLFTPAARWLRLRGRLAGFTAGMEALRAHHVLTRIVLFQAALVALTATGLWLACLSLRGGEHMSWPMSLMLALILMASGIANVTPGNVGLEQGATELTARLLNFPPGLGFTASVLFRLSAVAVVFAIGPVFSAYLARQKSKQRAGVPHEPVAAGT